MDTLRESYEWARIPLDLPKENLVLVKAKTTKTTIHPEDKEGYVVRNFDPKELYEAARSLAQRPVGVNHIPASMGGLIELPLEDQTITGSKYAFTVDANWNEQEQAIEALLYLPLSYIKKIKEGVISKVSVEYNWREEERGIEGITFKGLIFNRVDVLVAMKAGDSDSGHFKTLIEGVNRGLMEGIIETIQQDQIQASVEDPSLSYFKKAEEALKTLGEPFAGFKDWDACIAYAERKGASNPAAYCGHIKAKAEPKRESCDKLAERCEGCELEECVMRHNPLQEAEFKPPEAGTLPEEGQKILAAAYSSCRKDNPNYSKTRCSKIAWGAVKNAGYVKEDDKWTKKEGSALSVIPDVTLKDSNLTGKQVPEIPVNPVASEPAPMSVVQPAIAQPMDPENKVTAIGIMSNEFGPVDARKPEEGNPDKNLNVEPPKVDSGEHDSKKEGDTVVDIANLIGGEQPPKAGIGTLVESASQPTVSNDTPAASNDTPSASTQPPVSSASQPTVTTDPKDGRIKELEDAVEKLQKRNKELEETKDKAVKEAKEETVSKIVEKVNKVLPSEQIIGNAPLSKGYQYLAKEIRKALKEAMKSDT